MSVDKTINLHELGEGFIKWMGTLAAEGNQSGPKCITIKIPEEVITDDVEIKCVYADLKYSDGAVLCQADHKKICNGQTGSWKELKPTKKF